MESYCLGKMLLKLGIYLTLKGPGFFYYLKFGGGGGGMILRPPPPSRPQSDEQILKFGTYVELVHTNVLTKFQYLKTLFNIVEAPFKKLLNFDVGVVWWCSDGPINSQEYNSFEIYAVTIKISMTESHHWINIHAYHLF